MMIDAVFTSIFCIAVLASLVISVLLSKDPPDRSERAFNELSLTAAVFIVINLLAFLFDGNPAFRAFLFVLNLLGFLSIDVLLIVFSRYLEILIHKDEKEEKFPINAAVLLSLCRSFLTLVLTLSGEVFTIDADGFYRPARLFFVPYLFSGIIMLVLLVYVNFGKTRLPKDENAVVNLYLLTPIPAVIVEMFYDAYFLTGMFLTLSILLLYLLIQGKIIRNAKIRENLLEELSSKDQLTGLFNRRAYYQRLTCAAKEENVGILFCDINGLKHTNDTVGHAAGDRLILRFSEMLKDVFESDDIFRISGDEFVVLVAQTEEKAMKEKVDALHALVFLADSIAAIGFSFGKGDDLEFLIADAEAKMYAEKRTQYESGIVVNERSGKKM